MNKNFIFVTIKRGKKEYAATVSSFHYQGKNLWLYVFSDDNGEGGNCGYIPNARVIEASRAICHEAYVSQETAEIIKCWNIQ